MTPDILKKEIKISLQGADLSDAFDSALYQAQNYESCNLMSLKFISLEFSNQWRGAEVLPLYEFIFEATFE